MRESKFQADLIKELKWLFKGCVILKNDSSYIQGIPDLLILFNDKWAALECKTSMVAVHRVNQDYYIKLMNHMSFAAFIYPENKEDVLDALQHTFGSARSARIP